MTASTATTDRIEFFFCLKFYWWRHFSNGHVHCAANLNIETYSNYYYANTIRHNKIAKVERQKLATPNEIRRACGVLAVCALAQCQWSTNARKFYSIYFDGWMITLLLLLLWKRIVADYFFYFFLIFFVSFGFFFGVVERFLRVDDFLVWHFVRHTSLLRYKRQKK